MKTNKLYSSSIFCIAFTVVWLVSMILGMIKLGAINSFEKAINSVSEPSLLFSISYINALLVTVTVVIIFTSLFSFFKDLNYEWCLIGIIFVSIYSVINLLVYFSQITIVPKLVSLISTIEYSQAYKVLLGQFIQSWSGSAISAFNQLAYAILGIPSIIFGLLLIKYKTLSQLAGIMLAANGLFCIIGAVGTVISNDILSLGSVVGGVFFLCSLIIIVINMRKRRINYEKESLLNY